MRNAKEIVSIALLAVAVQAPLMTCLPAAKEGAVAVTTKAVKIAAITGVERPVQTRRVRAAPMLV